MPATQSKKICDYRWQRFLWNVFGRLLLGEDVSLIETITISVFLSFTLEIEIVIMEPGPRHIKRRIIALSK